MVHEIKIPIIDQSQPVMHMSKSIKGKEIENHAKCNQENKFTNTESHQSELQTSIENFESLNFKLNQTINEIDLMKFEIEKKINRISCNVENSMRNFEQQIQKKFDVLENKLDRQLSDTLEEKMENSQDEIVKLGSKISSIDEIITTKADYDLIHQKVSVEAFEALRSAFRSRILELKSQITQQERDFKSKLNEINVIVQSKLDKDEIFPLKKYLDKRTEIIQHNLESLKKSEQENEAAGTKYRLMRGVKCISCNKNVVMKIIEPQIPRSEPFLLKKFSHNHFLNKLSEFKIEIPKRPQSERSVMLRGEAK